MSYIYTKEKRNFEVLAGIIHIYVGTCTPVSSKSVTNIMDNSVSSATVRNIMAELEELGLIEQPYTSAGRVPTDLGYRKYVDMMKEKLFLEKIEMERLSKEFDARVESVKDIIEKTSLIIGRELKAAGVILWPSVGTQYLKHLELVKIRAQVIMVVLITMTNVVKNHIIKINKLVDSGRLVEISNYINSNYEGKNIYGILSGLKETLSSEDKSKSIKTIAMEGYSIMNDIMSGDIEDDIYISGFDCFAERPEFAASESWLNILRILADRRDMIDLMRAELPDKDIRVYIGKENSYTMLKECTFITSGYNLRGETVGRIGILGPTRIDYDNAIRTIRCLSDLISAKIEEIEC